jgi:molecular chaperone DnaK (HSP70)
MIGVPAIQDEVWLEHYRSHMREVTRQIGFREDPAFLYEPFAVFQFYRHVEKLIAEENRSQVILLIDIGGGTCNTCIVKTTAEGKIALGSQPAKPYGPKAVDFGGKGVDIQLLAAALKSRKELRFKDNPVERAKNSLAALLRIEDAKIDLSSQLR